MNKAESNAMAGDLSMEQQFELQVIQNQVENMSLEHAQIYVVEVTRQMMVKDNLIKQWLKKD